MPLEQLQNKKNKKWYKLALLALAAVGIFFYYVHDRQIEQAASLQSAHDDQVKKAAEAVTVVPPGTEEAWNSFIDRRIASALLRNRNAVKLVDYIDTLTMSKTTFVSVNSPYTISCNNMGSSIDFPSTATQKSSSDDDDTGMVTVSLYMINPDLLLSGLPDDPHRKHFPKHLAYINPDPTGEQPPPLGVDIGSVAADNLRARLCQRITDKVQSIMSPQAQLAGGTK